jgi:hypothetical protein
VHYPLQFLLLAPAAVLELQQRLLDNSQEQVSQAGVLLAELVLHGNPGAWC